MKQITGKAALAAIFIGGVALANAQSNGPTGLSARIGAFFPTNTTASDLAPTWFGFGADYKLNNYGMGTVGKGMPAFLSLSADFYEKNGFRGIPIGLNFNVRSGQLVFAAGVDIDFERTFNEDTTGIGGQLAATYEFAGSGKGNYNPLFIQAKYFVSSKSELDGFGVFLGVRF